MSLSQGDRLGRYEVLGPIGSGGMGEVWRARDTELGREVAVKVLPDSFADDETRLERFQREAKALAALSHPNLLDIYDVGSSKGLHYAVTELLEGDTLRERITPTGLPWQKVTQIGASVADGLAAAHGRGIIHRDLKPENLFLTADGRVKILDFGLAAMHEDAAPDAKTATITEAGTVMGTPGYMSPEQVKGQQADARSDIFAFGCVLYEMVSGHRAFGGDTGAEVIASILKEEPPQLSSSGAAVPVDLERAVHRCLEKRSEARFQSAADLAYSLRGVGHSGTAPVMATPQPSTVTDVGEQPKNRWPLAVAAMLVIAAAITSWWALTRVDGAQDTVSAQQEILHNRFAVVPFENRTGDPSFDPIGLLAADRIAQGLSETKPSWDESDVKPDSDWARVDIVPTARIRELFPNATPATAQLVAGATGARIVVMGTYIRRGGSIEFDGSITDTSTDVVVHVFEPISAPIDDPGNAIATLRDHTAIAVTDHVSPLLGALADDRFPKLEAYEVFLNALHHYFAGDDVRKAVGLVQRTLEIDPDFNRARLWLLMAASREFAGPILDELDARSDELNARQLLYIQAKRATYASDWEGKYQAYRRLTDMSPSYGYLCWFAMIAAGQSNRPEAVLELWERLKALEGEGGKDSHEAAEALHLLGRYEEELAVAEHSMSTNPDGFWEPIVLARALVALGRFDEVEQLSNRVLQTFRSGVDAGEFLTQVARFLRTHGNLEEGRAMGTRAYEWYVWAAEQESDLVTCQRCPAEGLLLAERFDEALAELGEVHDAENMSDLIKLAIQGICAARTGDLDLANQAVARLRAMGDPPDAGHSGWATYMRSCIAAHLGDRDEALLLLRRSLAEGFRYGVYHHHNPFNEPLRDHPEFQEIMRPKG